LGEVFDSLRFYEETLIKNVREGREGRGRCVRERGRRTSKRSSVSMRFP
jgi:hypothetical protein